MHRRNFIAALCAAPVAALAAVKMKEIIVGVDPAGKGDWTVISTGFQPKAVIFTREQQKRFYYAHRYSMSSKRFKELFNA